MGDSDNSTGRASSSVKLSKSILTLLEKPKELFLKELYDFMETVGQPITKMPSLGYQELDLHRLFHAVVTRGGMDEVTKKQEWKLVYQDLEIPTMSTSASYNTRTNYKKYLYLYELEVCDWGEERPVDAPEPRFKVGDYVRIVSSTFEGQVFYAQISKYRYRNNTNSFYVHYNGWSTSHDEWMPESVLGPLYEEEKAKPEQLNNPSPTRSSKSNYIIYDPMVSEKIQNKIIASGGSVITTPKPKRKKSITKDDYQRQRASDGDDYDDEDELAVGHITSLETSPNLGAQRQSRRRHVDKTAMKGKVGFLLDELDHPAMDDRIHGFPRRRRTSFAAIDMELNGPEQLYYNGGQWKHSTPRVRKFHVHRTAMTYPPSILPVSEQDLEYALPMPAYTLPSIPKMELPKFPAPKGIPKLAQVDSRPTPTIQSSIAQLEAHLKELKRDLKHKTRLLDKYYGGKATRSMATNLLTPTSGHKAARR